VKCFLRKHYGNFASQNLGLYYRKNKGETKVSPFSMKIFGQAFFKRLAVARQSFTYKKLIP